MAAIYKPARILEEPALDKRFCHEWNYPIAFEWGPNRQSSRLTSPFKSMLRKKLSINKLVRSAMAGILLSSSLSFLNQDSD